MVTITDSQNVQILGGPYTIDEPSELTASVGSFVFPNVGECDGGATVTPEGGQAPYTFLWSSGEETDVAVNLCEALQVQTVIVTDALGCITIVEFEFDEEIVFPTAFISAADDVRCAGDANGLACVEAFGGVAPYDFLWSTGETTECIANLLPGTYTCLLYTSPSPRDRG